MTQTTPTTDDPSRFRWSLPDKYRLTPLIVGYEIEIGYDRTQTPTTHLYALTRRGAEQKALRFIAEERKRLQAPAAPWTYGPHSGPCASCGGTNGTHNDIPVALPNGHTKAIHCPKDH